MENDLLALPIVDNLEQRHIVGMVRRYEVASTYLRHIHGPNAVSENIAQRFNTTLINNNEEDNKLEKDRDEQSLVDQPDDDQL